MRTKTYFHAHKVPSCLPHISYGSGSAYMSTIFYFHSHKTPNCHSNICYGYGSDFMSLILFNSDLVASLKTSRTLARHCHV